jgi:hypothetical protein
MVVTRKPPFDDFILFDDLPLEAACRLVVAGHYHPPLSQTRADGVRFSNPGSVCRLSLKADELSRQPAVLLADYALDGSDIQTEMIPLQSCLPAAQVFRLAEARSQQDQAMLMDRYLAQISAVMATAATNDLLQSLLDSGRSKGVSEDVIARAAQAVGKVQQG